MKKLLALLTAAVLVMAAVPVLAFTGYDEAPDMPVLEEVDEMIFDFTLTRVENEPEIGETPWGETYNTWVPMGSDPKAEIGETVTYAVDYEIPASIEGFTEEELNQIVLTVFLYGVANLEIADATGLETNMTCDFEAGYCYPLPGYGNAEVLENSLFVYPKVNTTVQVIIRGVVAAENVRALVIECVGQTTIPTHYSIGKVEKIDGGYYVYNKDIYAVQIRGMKFFTEDDVFDHYYVCLNDIDYIRSTEEKGVSYTRVDDPSVVYTEGAKFDALERGYNDVMGFFGFTDDEVKDVMTDSVFLVGSEPKAYTAAVDIMTDEPTEPEPTEPEPTEPEPTEPADPEPTDPVNPPDTGAVSLAVIGVIAVAAGAGVVLFKKH